MNVALEKHSAGGTAPNQTNWPLMWTGTSPLPPTPLQGLVWARDGALGVLSHPGDSALQRQIRANAHDFLTCPCNSGGCTQHLLVLISQGTQGHLLGHAMLVWGEILKPKRCSLPWKHPSGLPKSSLRLFTSLMSLSTSLTHVSSESMLLLMLNCSSWFRFLWHMDCCPLGTELQPLNSFHSDLNSKLSIRDKRSVL